MLINLAATHAGPSHRLPNFNVYIFHLIHYVFEIVLFADILDMHLAVKSFAIFIVFRLSRLAGALGGRVVLAEPGSRDQVRDHPSFLGTAHLLSNHHLENFHSLSIIDVDLYRRPGKSEDDGTHRLI